jgi:hypothetical protein
MRKFVRFSDLSQTDKQRIKRGMIYPYDTPGYGVNCYLYPVDKEDKLVGESRRLKADCKRRPTQDRATRVSLRYR